jgi:hypothetical protein
MPDDRPDLSDVLDLWEQSLLRELHTSFPGKVERYDPQKQVVDVQPMIRRAIEDTEGNITYEDYPVLPSLKLQFPRVGKWFITFPVARGDWVMVQCCEGSIGHLLATGEKMDTGDLRRHHLSHAVAQIGFAPFSQSLTNVSTTDMVLGHDDDGAVIAIKPNGEIHLAQNPAADYLALGSRVDDEFTALKNIFTTWEIVPQDGGQALSTLLEGWHPSSVKASKVKGT